MPDWQYVNVLAFDNELNKPANSWPRQLAGGASSGQSCENRVSLVKLLKNYGHFSNFD